MKPNPTPLTPGLPAEKLEQEPSGRGSESFLLRHRKAILFCITGLCLGGIHAALKMPSAVFPETDFPRVVILIDNGVMPADEMMATITRPIEESMKDIPGSRSIRSATGRGSAEVNVFFDWSTDMVQAELYVLGRVAQIRPNLPPSAQVAVHRLTFASFPILGISLTSPSRSVMDLWEKARYDLKPRFLRIKGVARIKLVGGKRPEYHVIVDSEKLQSHHLSIDEVSQALAAANQVTPAGMHEENKQLYLTVMDDRIRTKSAIEKTVVRWSGASPTLLEDVAIVRRGAAPQYNIVTADGTEAVLLNVYRQPNSDTVAIVNDISAEMASIGKQLPAGMRLAVFYDQSQFVREGIRSVWESIMAGLLLSILVLYAFLRSLRATFVAAVVIPVTVLMTLLGLRLFGMAFDLMTLGGIAAAIGLIIDDAIVVVEAIHTKIHAGHAPVRAAQLAIREVGPPLVGSTLTPTVVFIPLAFLDGVAGVFFKALALTMVMALLTSLLLAVTWTPTIGAMMLRPAKTKQDELAQGGPLFSRLAALYEWLLGKVLGRAWLGLFALAVLGLCGGFLYWQLESDFLPAQDEGAFVLDYFSRPGTSLSETDRMLRHVELILRSAPEVESYSRRTGARLALAIAEPNSGDFLVKLKPERSKTTQQVIDKLRAGIQRAEPALHTEFPGILSDLIGDLTWSPDPVEIKLFSANTVFLRQKAREIASAIQEIPGVVDINDGLVVAGPSLSFHVREASAARAGLAPSRVGQSLRAALFGKVSSFLLAGDRTYGVRVLLDPRSGLREQHLAEMPLHSAGDAVPLLGELATMEHGPGILEMHREDLRQLVAVSARFSGIDMGHGIQAIKKRLKQRVPLPPGVDLEYGGLFKQQQDSFQHLALVLVMAIFLMFGVLVLEFRSFLAPLSIVLGSLLALLGVIGALYLTGTTLNIVSFLGAIIGVGIVAKNGILMLDFVDQQRSQGHSLTSALVLSGRRRLRPVLMTSLATFLGLLPLAYGVGAGADMLRPLAIGVLGALAVSLLLSLIATPLFYFLMQRLFLWGQSQRGR